jgi:iron transport multicopper oxidase
MAISLSFFPILSALLLIFSHVSEAATVVYDFNITWVRANPDGAFERPTIGINNQWPLPVMTGTVGDQIIVNVDNQLGNQTTTLHFHGLFMNGSTEMDGPSQVSQCPIPVGSQFTYNFTVSIAVVLCNRQLMISAYPIWNLLVSFSRQGTIPRRSSGTIYHQRSRFSIRL